MTVFDLCTGRDRRVDGIVRPYDLNTESGFAVAAFAGFTQLVAIRIVVQRLKGRHNLALVALRAAGKLLSRAPLRPLSNH